MQLITSRAIIGMYYEALNASNGANWLDGVSNYFTSDQPSETYAWLGMPPALREWVGGRSAKGFTENGITIANKHFEATIDILVRDLRRDKTGQLQTRINELAERGQSHYARLLSTLILNAASSVCYDGQFFFDTDHSEGASGTQSNSITTTLAGLPAQVHGTATAPSPEEAQQAILRSISTMFNFVDDQGEPLNETAQNFLVMVPVGLSESFRAGLSLSRDAGTGSFDSGAWNINLAVNPRLTAGGWTNKFATFRTDGSVKALIRQEETEPSIKVKDENSEYAFDNDAIQVGIDTWRNVGYGRWQGAVLNTLA